jgi:D-serine deaminase-like pyridoxal phosphate-dependent protein
VGDVHEGRFRALQAVLENLGEGIPRLLVDLDALDRNIGRLVAMHPAERIRIVAKSLPSPELIAYVSNRLWGSALPPRLMVFHLPFLIQLSRRFSAADVLMGKPLPTAAVRRFHQIVGAEARPRVQWLADNAARLEQLSALAETLSLRLNVSLEIDIGMHRGGVASAEELHRMLSFLRKRRRELRLCGFMGYDAHAAKAPPPLSTLKACRRSARLYAERLAQARADFADLEETPWCLNGAGSPTFSLHGETSPLNDFSIGSALVKPGGFDLPSLADFEPAAWIATPVLKRLAGVHIPFLEKLPSGGRDSLFIYGGRWMASPASPAGLRTHSLYGLSSNQQLLTVPAANSIGVDDFVFLRPDQSEAVLLQFGDLLAVRGGEPAADWPVLGNDRSAWADATTVADR